MNFFKIKKRTQSISKKIFQYFFFLLYGKINGVLSPLNSKNVMMIKVLKDKIFYKIFIMNNARMYTDRVNDTAFILNNKIIDGPSYQLRPDKDNELSPRNNSNCKDNIIFKKGTPRIKKKINGTVFSLLSGGGANKNYFHWLYDVLPRLSLVDELKNNDPNFILVPNFELPFQRASLNILGFKDNQILNSKRFRHLTSEKIIATDHPYNIKNNTKIDHEKIPVWISNWLKKKFLNDKIKREKEFDRIYIDRDDIDPKRNSERRISNEDELRNLLRKLNFKFIKLKEKNFEDQISLFNNADIVLGLHGAGFANISFCKPNTRIIEIRSKNTGKIIENIAKNNYLNFNCLEYEPKKFSDKQKGLIEISIDEIRSLI